MRVFFLTIFFIALDFFRHPFTRKALFILDEYPLKLAETHQDGDVLVVLGFTKDHQPITQMINDYKEDVIKNDYSNQSTYFLLCNKFGGFLSVKERCAYQIKNNKLEKTYPDIAGDWFIRS